MDAASRRGDTSPWLLRARCTPVCIIVLDSPAFQAEEEWNQTDLVAVVA